MRNTNNDIAQHHGVATSRRETCKKAPILHRGRLFTSTGPLKPHRPSSPPLYGTGRPDESNGNDEETDFGSFDVAMLQAVVGELSTTVLRKLKDVSGSNVERGM